MNENESYEGYVADSTLAEKTNPVPPETTIPKLKEDENSAEETLNKVAAIVLFLGFVTTIILLFTLTYIDNPNPYIDKKVFNPTGFALTCSTFFSSLIAWAFMRVLANISLTLKDIKKGIDRGK